MIRKLILYLFYAGAGVSMSLLVLEIMLWTRYGGTEACGAGMTYVLCERGGDLVLAQMPNRVTWLTFYSWVYVEPWAIASIVLILAIFLSLTFLSPTRGFILALIVFELAIFSWDVMLANDYHTSYSLVSFAWLIPFQTMLKAGFLGQDLDFALLFVILVLAAARRFGFGMTVQIASLSLAVLPISIYFFDRVEFSTHAEGQFTSFWFVTNEFLLEVCQFAFLIGSLFVVVGFVTRQRKKGSNSLQLLQLESA